MSTTRHSTAFSHLLLAGTGIYCFHRTTGSLSGMTLLGGAYAIVVTHSVVGIWRWSYSEHGENAERLYDATKVLQTIFTLPIIHTQALLNQSFEEMSYIPLALAVVPFTAWAIDKEMSDRDIDVMLAINDICLGIVTGLAENWYGVATAVAFFGHFALRDDKVDIDLPKEDLYNYMMAVFVYCSFRAVA